MTLLRIGSGKAVLLLQNVMVLPLLVFRVTVLRCESKKRLGEFCEQCHGVAALVLILRLRRMLFTARYELNLCMEFKSFLVLNLLATYFLFKF